MLARVCFAVVVAVVPGAVMLAGQAKTPPASGKMEVALTGISSYKGPLALTCRKDSPDPIIQIEGRGADVFVRFTLHEPAKGTHTIVMEGLKPPAASHVRFDVLQLGNQPYVVPSGEATLGDATGKSGSLRAKNFTKSGGRLEPVELTLEATWTCATIGGMFGG